MALTASGIGSGLDIAGLVSQLMAVERQPLTQLAARQADYQAKLSAYGQYQSALATFQDAVTALQDVSKFSATRAQVAAGAGFSATSGPTAMPGTYAIRVEQLARPQLVTFVPTADSEGQYNVVLTAKNSAGEVETREFLDQSSITALAEAINTSGLQLSATIIQDGNQEWLSLRGAANGDPFTAIDRDIQTEYTWSPRSIAVTDGQADVAQVTQFIPAESANHKNSISIKVPAPYGDDVTYAFVDAPNLTSLRNSIANHAVVGSLLTAEVVGSELKLTSKNPGADGAFVVLDAYSATPTTPVPPDIVGQTATRIATFTPQAKAGAFSVTLDSTVLVAGVPTARRVTFTADSVAALADSIAQSTEVTVAASVGGDGALQLVSTMDVTGEVFAVTDDYGVMTEGETVVTDREQTPAPGHEGLGAVVYVDGIRVERTSNTLTDLIPGVTLSLTATMDKEADLTITPNHTVATKAVTDFVNAYNGVVQSYKSLTAYNAETRTAAILNSDGTLRNLQLQLRGLLDTRVAGISWDWEAGVRSADQKPGLNHMGIRLQKDGTLKLDSDQLATALSRPTMDVAGFFAGKAAEGTTPAITGFAEQIADRLDGYLEIGGLLDVRRQGIQASIAALERSAAQKSLRADLVEERLNKQFTALDILLSNMTATSNALTQQLAKLPGAYSGKD